MLSRTDSKIVQTLEKKMDLGTHALISIYMLEQMKNHNSTFWQPYIDILPTTFSDIPVFWSDAEVAELQGDALSRGNRRQDTLTNDYDAICANCPEIKETFTLKEYMWARTAVITRCFGIKVNGLTITYGKKANARFLVNYGFCIPINSRNKGHIYLDDAERFELEISETKVNDVVKRCREVVKDECERKGITEGPAVRKATWTHLYSNAT